MISLGFVKHMNGSCFFTQVHNRVPLFCVKPRRPTPPRPSMIWIKARTTEGADNGRPFDRMLPQKQKME
jgi:hypothetical protein